MDSAELVLDNVENMFLSMIKKEEVDLTILEPLDDYANELQDIEKNILKTKNLLDKFPYFHALQTQIRVINKMINRVKVAKEINDNPKVANDAMLVMPLLKNIHVQLMQKNFHNGILLETSTELQNHASELKMYPDSQEIIREATPANMKKHLGLLSERMGEEINEL